MTALLYTVEAVLAAVVLAGLFGAGLWLHPRVEAMPLWLIVGAFVGGALARVERHLSVYERLVGWHESIRLRIEERKP